MKLFFKVLSYTIILYSCGRHNEGFIVNKTNDTIVLALTLQDSISKQRPDNYFWYASYAKANDTKDTLRGIKECLISFDSSSKIALLKLYPNDMIELGTVRLDATRNNYKSWEFDEVKVVGNDF